MIDLIISSVTKERAVVFKGDGRLIESYPALNECLLDSGEEKLRAAAPFQQSHPILSFILP